MTVIKQFNVPFTTKKVYLPVKQARILQLHYSGACEVIETEVDGAMINRVRRSEEHVDQYLQFFNKKYGCRGQAYLIRQSSMNFENLNEIPFTSLLKQIL